MKFKNLFFIIIFIFLFVSGFVFYVNKAFLYSPETTHYNLTKEIIKFYNLSYDPDLSSRQIELILRGSVDEDIKPRPLFHLYDPVYNRAPYGIYTAKKWALENIQSSAIAKFANLILNIFSPEELKPHGDFSWPANINYYTQGDSDKAYYGLGHILHLIEDMTVPAHSRNDPHLPGDGDPYEKWIGNIISPESYNWATLLYNKGIKPMDLYSPEQVFDELAYYSNKYFFSIDTILSEDYSGPKIVKERQEDFERYLQRTYALARDENGELFRLAYRDTYKTDWSKVFYITEENYVYSIDEKDTKLNTDYWIRLAPKSVQYGAGVIKLFLEEAGYQVKLAKQEPELSWFQKAQIFIQDLFGIGEEEELTEPISIVPPEPLPQPKPMRFPEAGPAIQPPTPTPSPVMEYYLVQRVIDGDTILLENGQIVRYIGINAPEMPNGCFSQQALEKNRELVEGKKIVLEKDVSDKDSYGRLLRYVYLDSSFINEYLVTNGYAYDLVIAPDVKYKQELAQAEEKAKNLKAGLWGEACHPISKEPEEKQGEVKGATVVSGPKTGGGGGGISWREAQNINQPAVGGLPEEDTTPPDISIESLSYNYTSSSLTIEWTSSEIPNVYFDIDYKIREEDWQSLLVSTSETQVSLSISVQDIIYYFRVRAKDLVGNESNWQEKSIEIISIPVIINEIAWMGTEAQANDEWIELYNQADYEIDLTDWFLEAADGTPSINLSGIVSSHSYFLLERTADETISNILADQIYTGGLENNGESLSVKDDKGNIIDQVDCDTNWYAGDNENKRTMERVNPAFVGNYPENWQTYNGSGSGAVDADSNAILGTPKAQNSVYDAGPPTKINDLAVSDSLGTFLILQWTAPSDEKSSLSLTYDIRYASESISEENWASASQVSNIPTVENPGILQTLNISGLKYDTTYYFALKTSDGLNVSELSNILIYSTGSPPVLAKSSWPLFQRDVGHTGLSPYTGPEFTASSSISPKWISDLGAPIYASSVIGLDDTIYVGDIMGKFYAVNPINGEIKWVYDTYNYELGNVGIYFSAALASDGTIYFSAFGSYLYALTPNGKLKWKYQIGGPNTGGSSPVIGSDGAIYVTNLNGDLYAINPDGTLKWKYNVPGAFSVSAPVLGSDGTIYVSSNGFSPSTSYLTAFDSEGNVKWIKENINPMTGQALSLDSNDVIYVPSVRGSLNAVNPVNGSVNWFYPSSEIWGSAGIGPGGIIYVIDRNGTLHAINPDGSPNWIFGAGGLVRSSPIIDSNEVIYFGSEDKKIYAVNSDGSLKWNYELSEAVYASPVMDSDGTIYIASIDGNLYALRE